MFWQHSVPGATVFPGRSGPRTLKIGRIAVSLTDMCDPPNRPLADKGSSLESAWRSKTCGLEILHLGLQEGQF